VADPIAQILERLRSGRAEIAAMQAATEGTSIEFDAAKESAQLLESTIRSLASLPPEYADAVSSSLAQLIPEWQAYEEAILATKRATDLLKKAEEQQALAAKIATENRRRHEDAVAEFRSRQFAMAQDAAQAEQELMRDTAQNIAGYFQSAFMDVINGTEGVVDAFRNMAQQIIAEIQKILIQKAIIEPLIGSLFGGPLDDFGGGVDLGGLGGGLGHFASGGSVRGRQPIIVGERGPEVFIPASAGRIEPNRGVGSAAMGGESAPVIHAPVVFNLNNIDSRSGAQFIETYAPKMAAEVARILARNRGMRGMVKR
jgi:hypothetical protein